MTHPEMLKKLGLSAEEHKELMSKFSTFYSSLSESQKTVVRHTMPSAEQAAKSFGPGVTVEHVQSLYCEVEAGGICAAIAHRL
jgi:hypothetical protein